MAKSSVGKRGAVAKAPEQGLPAVIRRYLDGESVQVLAAEEGVHRNTIYNWLLAGVGDKAHFDLVTLALVRRVADADLLLEQASDQVEVSKAREMARFTRMDLERRRPGLYGSKQFNVSVAEVTVRDETVGRAAELLRLVRREQSVAPPAGMCRGGEADTANAAIVRQVGSQGPAFNTLTVPFEEDGPAAS